MKNKKDTNRRDFLKKAGLLFGAGITATSLSSLVVACKDETIPLPPPPPPGASYNIDITDYPDLEIVDKIVKCESVLSDDATQKLLVIVRVRPDDKFIIVQHNCTHQGDQELPASLDSDIDIVCPRHQAAFSMLDATPGALNKNPNVVNAPDLKVYDYEYKKDEKIIKLILD